MKEILHITDDVTAVCLMTLGYPAGDGFKTSRKPLDEIVCYNYFRE